jgi:3-oxoacyl-[acyl-carrier protein] reductase
MVNDLKDKVVLITGSSTGIGAAAALAFGKLGARVAVHCHSSRAAAEKVVAQLTAGGAQACLLQADVRDSAQCRQLVADTVKAFGRIDVLINNAGALVQRAPLESITDALFDEVVHLNVRSAMMCSAAAVEAMRRQGDGGNIINVTSVAARHGGGAGASLYAGSKGFVSTMTRGLAKELAKDNIRVNAVAPGVITTPFHDRFSTPAMLEAFKGTIPMNRLGAPEECAGAFVFLASGQMSGYVTGQILEVNGGQYMP